MVTQLQIARGCEQYAARTMCGSVLTERVPERYVILLDMPTWDEPGADGGYTANERREFYQQYTKQALAREGFPPTLFRNAGCYVEADLVAPDIGLLPSRPFVMRLFNQDAHAYVRCCLPVRRRAFSEVARPGGCIAQTWVSWGQRRRRAGHAHSAQPTRKVISHGLNRLS